MPTVNAATSTLGFLPVPAEDPAGPSMQPQQNTVRRASLAKAPETVRKRPVPPTPATTPTQTESHQKKATDEPIKQLYEYVRLAEKSQHVASLILKVTALLAFVESRPPSAPACVESRPPNNASQKDDIPDRIAILALNLYLAIRELATARRLTVLGDGLTDLAKPPTPPALRDIAERVLNSRQEREKALGPIARYAYRLAAALGTIPEISSGGVPSTNADSTLTASHLAAWKEALAQISSGDDEEDLGMIHDIIGHLNSESSVDDAIQFDLKARQDGRNNAAPLKANVETTLANAREGLPVLTLIDEYVQVRLLDIPSPTDPTNAKRDRPVPVPLDEYIEAISRRMTK